MKKLLSKNKKFIYYLNYFKNSIVIFEIETNLINCF